MKMIVVEGQDGTGKSTFTSDLIATLETGYKVQHLKFPTHLTDPDLTKRKPSDVLFYLNDFEKALKELSPEVDILICDRSFITTLVYQGFKEDSLEDNKYFFPIYQIGTASFFDYHPDPLELHLVYLTCDVETSLERTSKRKEGVEKTTWDQVDRMELVKKRKYLILLKQRYGIVLSSISHDLSRDYDRIKKFKKYEIDTTYLSPEETFATFLEDFDQ